jgi:hypothetical protein
MKDLNVYREKFYQLIESELGNVKPLISEQGTAAPAPPPAQASSTTPPAQSTAAQPAQANTAQTAQSDTAQNTTAPEKRKLGQILKLNGVTLVTKYRDSFIGFFKILNEIVSAEGFCDDPKNRSIEAFKSLNDIIIRMAQDNKMTNEQVIEFLYNQFNSGLGKVIIEIASQVIKSYEGEGEGEMGGISKEVLDTIFDKMRTTYPNSGPKVNSVVMEIMNKMNVPVQFYCDAQKQPKWSSPKEGDDPNRNKGGKAPNQPAA